ncbi:aminotransferase class V-fold PLP-dependent enzyme [Nonomuraea angiospora]|uniref:hypothetical protein n=1 Tax=Nonomuraea angiospora TaxID=46172 RepID=UPI0029B55838|nr:hypothetical protein [Nonomuraea angiospora]MDX3110395.1 hypothetical protein [Nonomuraea angiospora]
MIDVTAARALTPGVGHVAHFNNAGSALPSSGVLPTVIDHLRLEAETGGYEAAEKAADRLAAVHASAARLLNCAPDEIALVDSATRARDRAGRSINVSVSRAPSTLLDMTDRDLTSVVRASVHYYNTQEELDRLIEELVRGIDAGENVRRRSPSASGPGCGRRDG